MCADKTMFLAMKRVKASPVITRNGELWYSHKGDVPLCSKIHGGRVAVCLRDVLYFNSIQPNTSTHLVMQPIEFVPPTLPSPLFLSSEVEPPAETM